MKNIVLYNWAELDDSRGGGINVYQRNLVEKLLESQEYKVFYISSGWTYTKDKQLRIEEVATSFGERIKAYRIVNSPVLAPGQESIRNLKYYLEDEKLYKTLFDFLKSLGDIDIIHFQGIEGLSVKVFELKKEFSNTKFIYSAHNYFPVCTRVNLWKDELSGKGCNCDKQSYKECCNCYYKINYLSERSFRIADRSSFYVKMQRLVSKLFPDKENAILYKKFEEKTIEALNLYFDAVLAVSNRVKEILVKHGVYNNIVHVSYIGTKVAELAKYEGNSMATDSFNIVYMGYMNEQKGFYFFLNAMEKMKSELASKCTVRIVARHNEKNKSELDRLEHQKLRYKNIEIYNGYNKDNQKELLQNMHIGIVPVLWEDNLPQVAIEQIAYGVPIMVSNLGGAKELIDNDDFVFEAGDIDEFLIKLEKFILDKESLNNFWDCCSRLVDMDMHYSELNTKYYN